MELNGILKSLRRDLNDEVGSDSQRHWSDFDLTGYANNAVREIIKELLCLTADDDFTETAATGTITISGVAGQVSSVAVNGLVVTSGATPFNGTLSQTATDLAANINAFAVNSANTNPIKFTAQAVGAIVTISGPSGTGSTPNGYTVVPVISGGLSVVVAPMSGGACLCKLFVIPGQSRYLLHPKVCMITRFKPGLSSSPIDPKTKAQIDAQYPGWESSGPGLPFAYIPDYRNKKIILVVSPEDPDVITLDVVRFPYVELDYTKTDQVPEIPEEYHALIIPWVKRDAFRKNDAETLDLVRSETFEKEFYRMTEQIKARLENLREPPSQGISHYGMY